MDGLVLNGVTELAIVTPHVVAKSALVSLVDFSQGVVAQKQIFALKVEAEIEYVSVQFRNFVTFNKYMISHFQYFSQRSLIDPLYFRMAFQHSWTALLTILLSVYHTNELPLRIFYVFT